MNRAKARLVAVLAITLLVGLPTLVAGLGLKDVTFETTTIQGPPGTSFVYFQAHASSGSTTTVPTHRFAGCPVPYYVAWKNIVYRPTSTSYDIVIYRCSNGQPIDNQQRAGELLWSPGQQTLIAGVADQSANGRLVYALNVSLSPAVDRAGQPAQVLAAIAHAFVAQAERHLNVALHPSGWAWTSRPGAFC